jgi:transcriptional regulator with XRE-family HTH domain
MADQTISRLGMKVAQLREAAGLTQEQLGEQTGLSGSYVSRLENGHVNAKATDLLAIARVLRTTVTELLDEDREQIARKAAVLLDDPEAAAVIVRLDGGLRIAGEEDRALVRSILESLADRYGLPPENGIPAAFRQ